MAAQDRGQSGCTHREDLYAHRNISDIHGNRTASETVLGDLRKLRPI